MAAGLLASEDLRRTGSYWLGASLLGSASASCSVSTRVLVIVSPYALSFSTGRGTSFSRHDVVPSGVAISAAPSIKLGGGVRSAGEIQ